MQVVLMPGFTIINQKVNNDINKQASLQGSVSLTGAGNFWPKKDKYSICQKCNKKGFYLNSLVDKNNKIYKWENCKYCNHFKRL